MPRNNIIALLLLLIPFTAAAKTGWDLCVSSNQRFLQHTDGTPFFWLGDTGWLLPTKLDRDEARNYLQTAHNNGYNVVQVQTLCGVPCVNVYGQYSNNRYEPWDMSCFDNNSMTYTYWDHMDYIISEAERHGIYIAMDCIWGGLVKSGLIDTEGAEAYGTFLAERYKKHPNIIWMIGGDIQGDIKPKVWETLAKTIKSIDSNHLMTYHPRGRYTSAKWWAGAKWIDFHMYQSGHRAYGQRMGNKDYPIPDNTEEDCWMYVDSTWAYNPVKPVVDGEPSYEDIPVGLHFPDGRRWTASDVRRYAYWDVFAGCFGHTYGHNAIMQMHKEGQSVAYSSTSKTWYEAQRDSGYTSMKYLKALILSLPYFERQPDQSIIYKGNGEKYHRIACTRGTDYLLIYNYIGGEIHIDLTRISGENKKLWLMDTRNGKLTFIGVRRNGKLTTQCPPENVLIAIDCEKRYIEENQINIIKSQKTEEKDLRE